LGGEYFSPYFVSAAQIKKKQRWGSCGGGWHFFFVKLTYILLFELLTPNVLLSNSKEVVFGSIWKSPAPLKVVAFSWRFLVTNQIKFGKEKCCEKQKRNILSSLLAL